MAKRKWKVTVSMGYVGTDSTEYIDVVDQGFYTEEDLESLTDDMVSDTLYDDAFETAQQNIDISVSSEG